MKKRADNGNLPFGALSVAERRNVMCLLAETLSTLAGRLPGPEHADLGTRIKEITEIFRTSADDIAASEDEIATEVVFSALKLLASLRKVIDHRSRAATVH